jgi:single-strand DNA-binding protein
VSAVRTKASGLAKWPGPKPHTAKVQPRMATVSRASSRFSGLIQGEWVDETSFVDLTFFGRTAELVGQYLTKGSPIFVEGKLKQDTWEKDGQKRSKLYVIVERMQFLTGKSEGSKGDSGQKSAASSRFSDPNGYSGAPDSVQHPEIHEEPVYNDGEMPF